MSLYGKDCFYQMRKQGQHVLPPSASADQSITHLLPVLERCHIVIAQPEDGVSKRLPGRILVAVALTLLGAPSCVCLVRRKGAMLVHPHDTTRRLLTHLWVPKRAAQRLEKTQIQT